MEKPGKRIAHTRGSALQSPGQHMASRAYNTDPLTTNRPTDTQGCHCALQRSFSLPVASNQRVLPSLVCEMRWSLPYLWWSPWAEDLSQHQTLTQKPRPTCLEGRAHSHETIQLPSRVDKFVPVAVVCGVRVFGSHLVGAVLLRSDQLFHLGGNQP